MKMKLDNSQCVLVEFTNSHQLSVGYLSWVKENITLENVANYISNKVEVIIKWPQMWPLATTSKLEKLFDQIEFDMYRVTILASGSFVEMSSLAKNAENYGFLRTSLRNRSRLKRKNYREKSDEDTSDDSENELVRTYKTRSRVKQNVKITNIEINASEELKILKTNGVHETITTENVNETTTENVNETTTTENDEKNQTSDQNFICDKLVLKVLPTPESTCSSTSDTPEELIKKTSTINEEKNFKGTQCQESEKLKDNNVHEAGTSQKKQTADQNFKRDKIVLKVLPTPESKELIKKISTTNKEKNSSIQCQVIDLTCDIDEKVVNIDSLLLKHKILQLEYQVKCKESNKLLAKNINLEAELQSLETAKELEFQILRAELANLKQEKESMQQINCNLHREIIQLEKTIEEIKQKNIVQVNSLKEENKTYKDLISYLAKDIPIKKTLLKNERKKIELLEEITSGKNIGEVDIQNLLKNSISIININNTSLKLSRDNINEKSVKTRTDNMIKLGSSEYKVPESCLLYDSISDLTGNLFLALFSVKEIRELSTKLIFDKRMKALEDYVFTKYERSADNEKLLNLVIEFKCQDELSRSNMENVPT